MFVYVWQGGRGNGCNPLVRVHQGALSSKLPKELILTFQVPEMFAICTNLGRRVAASAQNPIPPRQTGGKTDGGLVRARSYKVLSLPLGVEWKQKDKRC